MTLLFGCMALNDAITEFTALSSTHLCAFYLIIILKNKRIWLWHKLSYKVFIWRIHEAGKTKKARNVFDATDEHDPKQ